MDETSLTSPAPTAPAPCAYPNAFDWDDFAPQEPGRSRERQTPTPSPGQLGITRHSAPQVHRNPDRMPDAQLLPRHSSLTPKDFIRYSRAIVSGTASQDLPMPDLQPYQPAAPSDGRRVSFTNPSIQPSEAAIASVHAAAAAVREGKAEQQARFEAFRQQRAAIREAALAQAALPKPLVQPLAPVVAWKPAAAPRPGPTPLQLALSAVVSAAAKASALRRAAVAVALPAPATVTATTTAAARPPVAPRKPPYTPEDCLL